jgi:hypothetical protein
VAFAGGDRAVKQVRRRVDFAGGTIGVLPFTFYWDIAPPQSPRQAGQKSVAGIAAILAVLGYFGLQVFDRRAQYEDRAAKIDEQIELYRNIANPERLLRKQVEVLQAPRLRGKR